MYHETHIFMFGLKMKSSTVFSCSGFIHLQADRQMDRQTDGYICLFVWFLTTHQPLLVIRVRR